jgi:hypothetical protein
MWGRSFEPSRGQWCNSSVLRAMVLVGALGLVLALAVPAQAAAPDYILVSGPGLAHPVLLARWEENARLLLAVAGAPRAKPSVARTLARRPRFDLAEFWGWSGRARPTRPSQANQHGRFYPARGTQPPVITVMVNGIKVPRIAPARALRILARHGVPIRV